MLSQADLALRRTCITATDLTILAGVSPYRRTVHDVYLDKLGLSEPLEPTQATGLGHLLEPVALSILASERGLTITPGLTEVHPIMTWIGATPDGNVIVDGKRVAVAEAKAVGLRMAHRWGESGDPEAIPDDVLVQCHGQMIVTRTQRAHVVALIGTEARLYELEKNEDLAVALLEIGDKFWRERVLAKVAPDIDGSEASARMVRGLFRRATTGIVPAPPEANAVFADYVRAKTILDTAEREKTAAQAKLCAMIGESEGLEGPDWVVTWKARAGSPDWKLVAEKLGATKELAEQYKREGPRVINVKLGKAKAKKEAA